MTDKDLEKIIEYMKNYAIIQIDIKKESSDSFMQEIEKKAAELEVTCDYYIQEFVLD